MSQRSAAETVSRIFLAFLVQTSWSQTALAKRVGIGVRAVRERLIELERSGMPLEREEDPPEVVWTVPNGWFPDGLTLAKGDVAAVLRFIARSPRSMARDAILRKLLRSDPTTTVAANAAPLAEPEPILSLLEDARAARRAVKALYWTSKTGIETWRHMSVQRIEYATPMRFFAYCHKAKELRTFRVSGVREARLDATEPYADVPEAEVRELLARSVDGWADKQAPRPVSFVVYGDDARWVPGNLPSLNMTVETCEGGIRVRTVTSGVLVIARFVVSLGGAAVAETPELADLVADLARGSLARSTRRVGGDGAGVVKAWNGSGGQGSRARGVI